MTNSDHYEETTLVAPTRHLPKMVTGRTIVPVTMGRVGRPAMEREEKSMSTELRDLIAASQAAFKADPEQAKAVFSSKSALQEGLRSEAAMREHRVTVDEPEMLGGTDAGPNPVELVLAALGTCQEITYRAYATALGIPLDEVSVELDGELDLRGFLAVDDTVRPGYQGITGTVTLKSSASEAELRTLREAVNAHCPVLDILRNPVPVELSLKTGAETVAAAE